MTKKELERIARNGIYVIGCNSKIAKYLDELGYNHGMYGWNWTALNGFCGIAFVFGYREFPKNSVYHSHIIDELENELNIIDEIPDVTWETKNQYAKDIIWEYCSKLA